MLAGHPRLLLFEFDLLPVLVGGPFAQNLRCIIWDLCGPLAPYVYSRNLTNTLELEPTTYTVTATTHVDFE